MSRGLRIAMLFLALVLVLAAPTMVAAAEGHGGEAKKGDKKEAGKAENGVIDIGPMVVNVLSTKGYRYLRLGLEVQCVDNVAAERLVKPDATEDRIFLLSSKVAEDLLTNAGKMVLRKELLELFAKYVGAEKVKNLYFTEFVFQ